MTAYNLLLDSGSLWSLRGVRSKTGARLRLASHNQRHRDCMARRAHCQNNGDYLNMPLVCPRLATGIVCMKPTKKQKASQ